MFRFFVLLFVYIVGGVAFQVGVRKSSGKEIIPNYTWWFSLPTLIKVCGIVGSISHVVGVTVCPLLTKDAQCPFFFFTVLIHYCNRCGFYVRLPLFI